MLFVSNAKVTGSTIATIVATLLTTSLVVACSGGGGGGGGSSTPPSAITPTPTPAVANRAPVITSSTSATIAENEYRIVYQAAATDPDGDVVMFAISGGVDAAQFTITSAGSLRFVGVPNYEAPGDADRNNVYQVEITASDGRIAVVQAITISVTDIDDRILANRVATGFVDPVSLAPVSSTELLVLERSGAIYLLNPRSGTRSFVTQLSGPTAPATGIAIAADENYASLTGLWSGFFAMYRLVEGTLVVERIVRSPTGSFGLGAYWLNRRAVARGYLGGGAMWWSAPGELMVAIGDGSETTAFDTLQLGGVYRVTRNPDPYSYAAATFFDFTLVAKGLRAPVGGAVSGGSNFVVDQGAAMDEINAFSPSVPAVANFGWPFKDGNVTVGTAPMTGLIDPAVAYSRATGTVGQGIVGGAVGGTGSVLRYRFVFADRGGALLTIPVASLASNGGLTAAAIERRNSDIVVSAGSLGVVAAMASSPTGTLYLADADGQIFEVTN